jgi:hypothetical protein
VFVLNKLGAWFARMDAERAADKATRTDQQYYPNTS